MKNEPFIIFAEEAAELIQAICKWQRYGADSFNPLSTDQKTNRDKLIEEMGDVLALIELVQRENDLDLAQIEKAKKQKFVKLKQWSKVRELDKLLANEPDANNESEFDSFNYDGAPEEGPTLTPENFKEQLDHELVKDFAVLADYTSPSQPRRWRFSDWVFGKMR